MTYKVAIRKNDTGEVRVREFAGAFDEVIEFMWCDGNFACDCNRALEFARAVGEEDAPARECGITAFAALYAELPDGTRVELDAPD